MAHVYEYEYTDTFAGGPNYSWVERGRVTMPELTHYGYDGSRNYSKANKIAMRELMRRVKAKVGLTDVRGRRDDFGDIIEFRPYARHTVLFVTFVDE